MWSPERRNAEFIYENEIIYKTTDAWNEIIITT